MSKNMPYYDFYCKGCGKNYIDGSIPIDAPSNIVLKSFVL